MWALLPFFDPTEKTSPRVQDVRLALQPDSFRPSETPVALIDAAVVVRNITRSLSLFLPV